MFNKTKLLSPHMAIVTALAAHDLNSTTGLQRYAGGTAMIPMLKLNPEHVPAFLQAIDAQAKSTEMANQRYWSSAVGYLKQARERFVENHAASQNGAGDHAQTHAGTVAGTPQGAEHRAS